MQVTNSSTSNQNRSKTSEISYETLNLRPENTDTQDSIDNRTQVTSPTYSYYRLERTTKYYKN